MLHGTRCGVARANRGGAGGQHELRLEGKRLRLVNGQGMEEWEQ